MDTSITKLTGLTKEHVDKVKAMVAEGDITPIRDILVESVLILHFSAINSINNANIISGSYAKCIDSATRAVKGCEDIYKTLSEHSKANKLSDISAELFEAHLERILRFLARRGGSISRNALLSSRVIKGSVIDWDRHLAALIDNGLITAAAQAGGKKKDLIYFLASPNDNPIIEVTVSDKAV